MPNVRAWSDEKGLARLEAISVLESGKTVRKKVHTAIDIRQMAHSEECVDAPSASFTPVLPRSRSRLCVDRLIMLAASLSYYLIETSRRLT